MVPALRPVVAVVLVAVGLTGCARGTERSASDGSTAASPTSTRWVDVTMTDNAFEPARIEASAGERVRFRFANEGSVLHEAVIGTEAEQADHAAAMADMGDMGDMAGGDDHAQHHGALQVRPGETGVVSETFTEAGTVVIGCHQPGHYEAGMRATVEVG